MKFRFCAPFRAALGLLLLVSLSSLANAKEIRLRNETINVDERSSRTLAAKALELPGSGLLLIQFTGTPTEDQRKQIESLGLKLLHYVPTDAFVARAKTATTDQLRALPFVSWVGEYRPDHKLHRSLQAQTKAAPNSHLNATILMAPGTGDAEATSLRSAFSAVQQESNLRSGRIIRGQIPAARLEQLSRSDAVLWIEPAPRMRLLDEVSSKLVAGDAGQGRLLAQDFGYDGSGVTVAVADSGLNNGDAETMHPDLYGRTPAFFAYGGLWDAADEHSHGTHVAGIIAGDGATGETDEGGALYGLGVAPGAKIVAQRLFDGAGAYYPPDGFDALTTDALNAGAEIGSNSWGDDTQGRYDTSAMEFDELVRDADPIRLNDQPYILEFSAGNAGPSPQTIGSPAVAKNVIATGASQNDRIDFLIYGDGPEEMADFSSRGPCEDGRIKPDVVAPGTYIASLQSFSATDEYAWAPISPYYQYQGGTSQAGPHASGAAAVFVQFYRDTHNGLTPSPALVKAALINTAVDLFDSADAPTPNHDEGWGRIDLVPFFDSSLVFDYTDQTALLTEGQVFEKRVILKDNTQPLKITLTYTDVPGFPGASPALVNNLDLEVIGPGGVIYLGNHFNLGESVPNATNPDSINNVEGVHLWEPQPGLYTIRVRASKIVSDARLDTFIVDQDFALIISAEPAPFGTGVISLDRGFYRTNDPVVIQLIDEDLAGQPTATVQLTSSIETVPESILLRASGSFGFFTGAVALATGPAVSDGKLQVANGSQITASYFDVSAALTRSATARADFVPPQFLSIQITNAYGQAVITVALDETSAGIIRFGTNKTSLDRSLTNSSLSSVQEFVIPGLTPGITWYFDLVCRDEAGNASTNNNSGQYFSFSVPSVPPVLVVDSFPDNFLTLGAPPLSGYTDALEQIGVPYQVWDATTNAAPSAATMSAYRAVIWRVPELMGGWSVIEQTSISNYLANGGALMVASMEVLSRLTESGSSNFIRTVLQVDSFAPDPESTGAQSAYGVELDPITDGLDLSLDYETYLELWGGLIGPDISDTMIPSAQAISIFKNDYGHTIGLRWPRSPLPGDGRLVLLTFPLDAVPSGTPDSDRGELLRRILDFLAPGSSSVPSIHFDSTGYNIPSAATVQVADISLAGLPSISAAITSLANPSPVPLNLKPTVTPGVFRGSFNIISLTNPPVAGTIQSTNGDVLTASFVSQPSGATLAATARVDTQPPVISLVEHEEEYTSALIYWETDEPADSLVQFGESPLLGKTAFQPEYSTSHEVSLPFLLPDREYYYRVVSRDAAGNTTTDDNASKLYKLRTLAPMIAPWSDNMDTGATNWSTYSSPDSTVPGVSPEWQLGTPNNALDIEAHSAPSAWGTSLNGSYADSAECFLISPAIYLTNGNSAKLRFWHNYDFMPVGEYDILEFGQVYVIPNDGAAVPLAGYVEASFGWEEEEFDLTPYAGQVIYVAWHYGLISLEAAPRSGWLVDDVSITVSNVSPGTVVFTNNIWQASCFVRKPLSRKMHGRYGIITNAPAGTWEVRYPEVAWYIAPPPQTNELNPGQTIVFEGNYTFPDSNQNGMSDVWEQVFFGIVSEHRTAATDSDGDGMTDGEEFQAGTNPNSPVLPFKLTAARSNAWLTLQWPSVPGQQYRLLFSSNYSQWFPVSEWLTASTPLMQTQLLASAEANPVPDPGSTLSLGPEALLRVQAGGATNPPTQLPPQLRLTITPWTNSQQRLSWVSARYRGYRVEMTTNVAAQTWTTVSDWSRANSPSMSVFVPAGPPNQSQFFRLRVAP